MNDLTKKNHTDLIDPQAHRIIELLTQVGLPSDNIIAEQSERAIIGQNLPTYIENLPVERKQDGSIKLTVELLSL